VSAAYTTRGAHTKRAELRVCSGVARTALSYTARWARPSRRITFIHSPARAATGAVLTNSMTLSRTYAAIATATVPSHFRRRRSAQSNSGMERATCPQHHHAALARVDVQARSADSSVRSPTTASRFPAGRRHSSSQVASRGGCGGFKRYASLSGDRTPTSESRPAKRVARACRLLRAGTVASLDRLARLSVRQETS
jgi:hypothetical protein